MKKQDTNQFLVSGMYVENDPKTGRVNFDFQGDGRRAEFSLEATAAVNLFQVLLVRLMERNEEAVQKGLQIFALKEIDAKIYVEGSPYLDYTLECGLRFGSGLPREWLEKLYHQLGDVLAHPLPDSKGETNH